MKDSFDAASQPTLNHDASSNLRAQVFSDPVDFLKTIKDNFGEISHGHQSISLDDLKAEAQFGSTAKIRAASEIAADHVLDLGGIATDSFPSKKGTVQPIEKGDLDFAIDMANHNTGGYAFSSAALKGYFSAGLGVAGGALTAFGTGAVIGEGVAVATVGALGLGVAGLGAAAYLGYEAYHANAQYKQLADQDSAMFRSWIAEPHKTT
jgi:hypothetical protein